ncbi:thiamine biosynthesis protein ThiS [Vibrio albus]|uniref:Thiamine biosynthesis protein ThiS n=1 Tax=Vibrio albus TaxID=2200953 RepID=A0A2U3B4P5_9VIBR|nr:sulfur carrier protein ThiS [Vibrio albus]PWI31747.1 thiamine biosynthesis protein ThiS [Vibrio albus]
MRIWLNKKPLTLNQSLTLIQLLEEQAVSIAGCAVAINNNIVPRNRWESTTLSEGDEISLFQAIAGG